MSVIADALQPFFVPQLASIAGRLDTMTLADAITAPPAGYDVNFDDTDESIEVDFREARLLTSALAADCSRLASAAFQTVATVPTEIVERDSVAWCLVKLYYAAFYAGHT